jgi:hypothetical protein
MSTLRDIMEQLARKRSGTNTTGHTREDPGNLAEQIKYKVDAYQAKLEECTPSMLQYEWAWLQQHIESLEHCVNNSSMCEEIGGQVRAEALLEESRQSAIVLDEEFKKRMLHPKNYSRPVEAGEHAWELSLESIRKEWGLD